jgi:nucleotide-binding universal stress UspA family protein
MYERILMPVDGSACAERAIEEGLRLASELGAEVLFLHAIEDPLAAGYATPESLPYAARLAEDLKKEAERVLDDAMARAARAGVPAKTRLVEHRDPVAAIRDAEADVDLVVIGTHGRRGMQRWMFGSVTEGALRRSGKPFLIFRSGEPPEPRAEG